MPHRWDVPPHHAAVIGPGSPLEVREEDVLGVPTRVFANRPSHLRAVLERAAATWPDQPYLVFPDSTLAFRDVLASAARVADWLARAHGVGKGDRVGFAAANVPGYPVGWWATISLGAVVSGLNGWWTAPELAYGIELTAPKVVMADARRAERLTGAGVPVIDLAEVEALLGPPRDDDPPLPSVDIDEDDPIVILFTSGTTGRPKGATLSHRIFVHCPMANMLGGALALPPGVDAPPPRPPGASLLPAPLFHVSGCLPLAVGPFFGSRIVFPPVGAWDPETHLRLTEEHGITGWSLVPTQFFRVLEHPKFDDYDTSSVQQVGGGGAVYAPELFRLMKEKLPNARVGAGYGMSETLGSGTRLGGVTLDTHPASVGTVEPLCEVTIRDEEGNDLPDGEVGEICIKGACVFLGYWDNPTATADCLDAERWYRTGDYGHFNADGVLFLESRMRDLIIRGGENIYPIEIENRLIEHPGIAEACVIGIEHRELGQEVAAVVVRHDGAAVDEDGVRSWVGEALASFKVPAHVVFLDELPYTATGKVVKHELETEVTRLVGPRRGRA